MKAEVLDRTYDYFQRVDRKPPGVAESLPLIADSERKRLFELRMHALRLPVDPLAGEDAPPIELLLVAAPKDFSLLERAAISSVANAGNPISKITVVVPASALDDASRIAAALAPVVPVEVKSEDEVLSSDVREMLRLDFGDRYGWILQQLLSVAEVAASDAAGVLVLDADTLLLRPRILLSGTRQVLMQSLEHHEPYFAFVGSLDPRLFASPASHVTHHMLQQPDVTRAIIEKFCGGDVASLARLVCERRDRSTSSSVCVDFELYAQGLLALYPERAVAAKWSNLTVRRSSTSRNDLRDLSRHYCSASLHHYV